MNCVKKKAKLNDNATCNLFTLEKIKEKEN